MPDIYDMELDARPEWSEVYANHSFCEEHGWEYMTEVKIYTKDLTNDEVERSIVRFCVECLQSPGENQFLTIGDNNEQTQIRSDAG
jgi:hypothetical protein